MASSAPAHPLDIELAPAPPSHPLRWRRLFSLLRTVGQDEERTDAALEIFDAVGGDGGERCFQRFLADAEGRRLIAERPVLVERMADHAWLETLPEQSLGRAYLAFCRQNGFEPDGLVQLNNATNREVLFEMDPVRGWFWDRFTAMHDLWHVVTGCDTSGDGEALLLAFSQAQMPQRGFAFLLGLSVVMANIDLFFQARLFRSWRRGRQASWLVVARWEELFERPLEEVRARLGVTPLMS